jgi:hypothetical protein
LSQEETRHWLKACRKRWSRKKLVILPKYSILTRLRMPPCIKWKTRSLVKIEYFSKIDNFLTDSASSTLYPHKVENVESR